jgi:hypothetical protein
MDGNKVQVKRGADGQRGPIEIRSLPARGSRTAGSREHEVLLAEGHYRCPYCRRADLNEKNGNVMRMR